MIRIELRDSRRLRQPQLRPRLVARLHAGVDQDRNRLRLLQRIDRVVADPGEFEIGRLETNLHHPVERALHPGLQRHEPFLRRLHAQRLRGRAIDLVTNAEAGTENA